LSGTNNIDGTGNDNPNSIVGNDGNNLLSGNNGADKISGGQGNDTLVAGAGNDTLNGGAGNDLFLFDASSTGDNLIEDGNNLDTLDLSAFDYSNLNPSQTGNDLILNLGVGQSVTIKNYYSLPVAQRINFDFGPIPQAYLSVNNLTVTEGVNNSAIFTVSLNQAMILDEVTVDYTTQDDSGVAGSDYQAVSGTLSFAPGTTTASITVPIIDNNLSEIDETFKLILSNPQNAELSSLDPAIATITDGLVSAITTTLPTQVENLTLTGTANINGTGNNNVNLMVGNTGNNTLKGSGGNDTLKGGAGNDKLYGDAGADYLEGEMSNDTYYVDNEGDLVIEASGAGTDTVSSTISYTLPGNVEKLTLTGTASIDGTGNELNNTLTGNGGNNLLTGLAGNDTLNGNAGNDTLIGGGGNDLLTGSTGSDVFRFDALNEGIDKIQDLVLTEDLIQINGSGFALSLPNGVLSGSNFVAGSASLDSDDHFIYEQGTGKLFFDADGLGGSAQTLIATLTNKVALTANNIVIV
jgi:Ca2+-binding RTX toxin-like protein